MNKHKLEDFKQGWFIGNFEPSLSKTEDVEIAVKKYQKGDYEPSHHHKIATEYTLILDGQVRMSGEEYGSGEIVVISPGESTDFLAETDVTTVVVKLPCAPNDKYIDP